MKNRDDRNVYRCQNNLTLQELVSFLRIEAGLLEDAGEHYQEAAIDVELTVKSRRWLLPQKDPPEAHAATSGADRPSSESPCPPSGA